jgi:hypothetical protein
MVLKTITTSETIKCDYVGDLEDGFYNLVIPKGGETFSSSFIIQKE